MISSTSFASSPCRCSETVWGVAPTAFATRHLLSLDGYSSTPAPELRRSAYSESEKYVTKSMLTRAFHPSACSRLNTRTSSSSAEMMLPRQQSPTAPEKGWDKAARGERRSGRTRPDSPMSGSVSPPANQS